MFEGIVAVVGTCAHCARRAWVAMIPPEGDDHPFKVARGDDALQLCAGCINALQRSAYYLRRLEAQPPKKPRKRARGQPRAIAPYVGPSKHDVSSLVPADKDLVSSGQPGAIS